MVWNEIQDKLNDVPIFGNDSHAAGTAETLYQNATDGFVNVQKENLQKYTKISTQNFHENLPKITSPFEKSSENF